MCKEKQTRMAAQFFQDTFSVAHGAVKSVVPGVGPALRVKAVRDELPLLLEQVEGLRGRLELLREAARAANTERKCGVPRLVTAVRRVEVQLLALFGGLTDRLLVLTGVQWYISEVARLEASLALELGLFLARVGRRLSKRECDLVDDAVFDGTAEAETLAAVEALRRLNRLGAERSEVRVPTRPRGLKSRAG
jgi:hypothetical protein